MKKLTSILGNAQKLDGGAMFGNAPKAMWSKWITPDEQNRIPLVCRGLLVQENNKNILLEVGIGAFFEPKYKERYGVVEEEHVLLHSLNKHGLTHEDIDVVILSHLHFDHAGGMLSKWQENTEPTLLFPNATIIVGETAWERARTPHPRDKASFVPMLNTLLEKSKRIEIIKNNTSKTLGPDYRFRISDGHTPGMLLTEITMPTGPIVFAADLIPGTSWVHVPITMGYDRYPEKVIEEKKQLLEYLQKHNGRLFYTHDATTALSNIEQDEKGRYKATKLQETITELTE